ncbi:zinc finger protein 718-like [Chrysoperla carnea]|uniref:zinc finger protein 718-like n=1 Tax=Chrysoperla carnea TaxID=189513 RepID=UPI001D0914C3|nr:zinc finger protein 718-like [Chrysoperla carnea]
MSFHSVCRLCANFTNEVDLVDIFGNKNDLESKIEQCFRLNLEIDNYQPKQVCIVCASKVHSYYEFFVQVQKAQLVFKSNQAPGPNLVETKVEVNDFDDEDNDTKFDANNLSYSGDENDPGGGSDDDYEDIKLESKQNILDFRTPKIKKKEVIVKIEESVSEIQELKKAFYKAVDKMSEKANGHLMTDETYQRFIRELEEAEAKTTPKTAIDYRRIKRFEILLTDDNVKKLIARRKKASETIKYYVPKSEMFELIRDAHLKCRHGALRGTERILKMKYKNLSREIIMVYLNLCQVCKNWKIGMRERLKLKEKQRQENSVNKPPPLALKCHQCGEIYHAEKDLREHFESVHEKQVEFICPECSKIFTHYLTFRNHVRSHKNEFKFRCEICDKFFSGNRELQRHKQRHNKIRKKYFCSSCGKGFLNDKYLTIHEKRAHSTPINDETGDDKDRIVRNHECDECHKMFASVHSLNNHKKVHAGVREHTCEHCGKSFIYKKYLDDHIASHNSERPFKCETCSASFKSKVNLRRHVALHTAVRSHQCHICGKKFLRKPALIEHSITHTDLYPFKCKFCDKSFRAKKNVVRHELLHTGEKPYSCDTCENRHFTCSSNYYSHMRRRHGMIRVKKEKSIAIVDKTNFFNENVVN